MRLIGLLSFFDDDPEMISESIRRVCEAGVDHVVAADGPYDLYPSEKRASSDATLMAVMDSIMDGCGSMQLLSKQWRGNEVEKRNYMLSTAIEDAVDQEDWFLVFDSDHMWETTEPLKPLLEKTNWSAAEVAFADGRVGDDPSWYEARLLLRAHRGMVYDGAHWRVRYVGGATCSTLRAGDDLNKIQLLDLREVARVWHAHERRGEQRVANQAVYYEHRDRGRVER